MARTNQYVNMWGLRVLGLGKITCKGPETWSLVSFRFRKMLGSLLSSNSMQDHCTHFVELETEDQNG